MSAVLDAPVASTPGRLFKFARGFVRVVERGIGIVIFLALWEALPRLGIVSEAYLSPPSAVVASIALFI
jgi:NitT/TauT family transport system permease protein